MFRVLLCCVFLILLGSLGSCCLPPANGGYNPPPPTSHIDKKKHVIKKPFLKQSPKKEIVKKEKPKKKLSKSKNTLAALPYAPLKKKPLEKPVEKTVEKKQPTLTLLRTVDDVPHPQSIIFDKKRLRFYVSRLGEKAQPDKGSIAMLARDGSVINPSWITGLSQPRGMAVVGKFLYVADGKALLKINIDEAKVVKEYKNKKAFYFYDVAANSKGELFLTDPLSNEISKLSEDEKFEVWVKDPMLSGPNSLVIEKNTIYISSIGLKKSGTSGTKTGGIYKIDSESKAITPLTKQKNLPKFSSIGLDGEGTVYATTDGTADLMRFSTKNGELKESINVQKIFNLKETQGLSDFQYFPQSKEFWVPVKNNGHILVFVRSDEALLSEGK